MYEACKKLSDFCKQCKCLYRSWSLNVALNYLKEATSPYKCEKCKKRRNPVNQNFPNYFIFARTILKKSNPY